MILTQNKHLNAGHYLVDDRLASGADQFSGKLLHFTPGSEHTYGCEYLGDVLGYLHLDIPLEQHSYNFNDLVLVREAWLALDPLGDCNQYDRYLDDTLHQIQIMQPASYIAKVIRNMITEQFLM